MINSVHEPSSRTMSKNRLRNNTESIRIENRPSAPSAQPVASPRAPPAALPALARSSTPALAACAPQRLPTCAPRLLPRPAQHPARPRARLLHSAPCRGLCCDIVQQPTVPAVTIQFLYCDTNSLQPPPSSHNTKHCIAIQLHVVQSLAIQILQYNPSLHKPQSQYKILYCNTNSPQISFSMQYNF